MGYQKVLVPVSGKYQLARAARALEQALLIVREDGHICFLHCIDEVPSLITRQAYSKLIATAAGEAEKLIYPLVERIQDAGIAYSVHIVEASPVTYIAKFASDSNCNVVVMCTDDHNYPDKFAMGGIAGRVFQHLSIPLLVMH